jgi:hypothetical protein
MFTLYNDVIIAAELCRHPVNAEMGKKLVVYLEEKQGIGRRD